MSYPTNKVANIDLPWDIIVRRADPGFARAKTRELFYDYPAPGRNFYNDPTTSGAYAPHAPVLSNRLMLEDGSGAITLEDGSGNLVLEA